MDKKVLELLTNRAKLVKKWITTGRHVPPGVTDFTTDNFTIERPRDGEIIFVFNKYAKIKFGGIQPGRVIRSSIKQPTLLNKKKVDSSTTMIHNQSDSVVERSYDFSTNETKTWNEDVGVAVEAGFSQKISYGGAASPVSGETTFSLSVNTSYNQSNGGSSSEGRDSTTTVECPPWTRMYITAENSKANFEQEIEVFGTIEHDIYIWSHKDAAFEFTSWQKFRDLINGEANDDVYSWNSTHKNEFKGLAAKYRSNPEWWSIRREVYNDDAISYKHKTTFANAVSGDVRVTSEAITRES